MKKTITNICLSLILALPLLPALSSFQSVTGDPGIQTTAYFEDMCEIY